MTKGARRPKKVKYLKNQFIYGKTSGIYDLAFCNMGREPQEAPQPSSPESIISSTKMVFASVLLCWFATVI